MEIVLSIAILGIAMAAIGELVRMGTRSAAQARELTTAQLLCESKMAELASGAEPLQSLSGVAFDNEGQWIYSIEIGETERTGLVSVVVTVQQNVDTAQNPIEFSLTRWMKDPGVIFESETTEETTSG